MCLSMSYISLKLILPLHHEPAPPPLTKTGARERRGRRRKENNKKKKLRKVGLEVELKKDKRINHTCVCGFFSLCFTNMCQGEDQAVSSQQLASDMHRYIPMVLQLLPAEVQLQFMGASILLVTSFRLCNP